MMLATLAPNVVPNGEPNRRTRQVGSLNVTTVTSALQASQAMKLIAQFAERPVPINELVLVRVRTTPVGVCSIRRDPLSGRVDVEWCHVRAGTAREPVVDTVVGYALA